MSHEDHVKALLGDGKAGLALVYLAQQLDAAEKAREGAASLDWSIDGHPVDERLVNHAIAGIGQMTVTYDSHDVGREWPVYEGLTLNTADFGWDGSPDTWTKEIGEDMYRAALKAIGDPAPGDSGEWAARRGLAADLRTPPTREVLYLKGETIGNAGYTSGEDDTPVTIDNPYPHPTPEQKQWRRAFAESMGWDKPDWLQPSGGEPIADSFVEFGPLLFFHGYREYLTQLNPGTITQLCKHWADCGFPIDAAIMTADLLKAEDSLDYDRALADAGQRSETLPQRS